MATPLEVRSFLEHPINVRPIFPNIARTREMVARRFAAGCIGPVRARLPQRQLRPREFRYAPEPAFMFMRAMVRGVWCAKTLTPQLNRARRLDRQAEMVVFGGWLFAGHAGAWSHPALSRSTQAS